MDTQDEGVSLDKALEVACSAAAAAAEIIRHYYAGGFEVTIKPDATPVTEADVAAEKAIREIIGRAFPEHGFWGEETGRSAATTAWRWLVDPIDGTKSFVRGYPFFSTQIALEHQGRRMLGVSSAPMFEELATAVRGQGAWLNGEPIRVSKVASLDQATVSTGNIQSLAASEVWPALGRILAAADRTRGYGDFYHYHLLASGRVDAVIESDLNILDIAALERVVTEAGGVMTDWSGHPPGDDTRQILAATPALHAAILPALQAP